MNKLLSLTILIMAFLEINAQTFTDFQWENRVLLVFTPSAQHPDFVDQHEQLKQVPEALKERKLKVIVIGINAQTNESTIYIDRDDEDRFYDQFQVDKGDFALFLVGLDGGTKLKVLNEVTAPDQIFALIDQMPMRRREMGH